MEYFDNIVRLFGWVEDKLKAQKKEIDRLKALLEAVLPECYVCPECGPVAKVDVDGCCVSCGRDCEIEFTRDALCEKGGGEDG